MKGKLRKLFKNVWFKNILLTLKFILFLYLVNQADVMTTLRASQPGLVSELLYNTNPAAFYALGRLLVVQIDPNAMKAFGVLALPTVRITDVHVKYSLMHTGSV